MSETLQERRNRLKQELDRVDSQIRREEYDEQRKREAQLKDAGAPRPYWSDDYAGIEGLNGGVGFYYGYEHQVCPRHNDCSCDEKEWCFVAMLDGKDICVIPHSKLNVGSKWNCMECLVAGIGLMVAQGLLVAKPGEAK